MHSTIDLLKKAEDARTLKEYYTNKNDKEFAAAWEAIEKNYSDKAKSRKNYKKALSKYNQQ